jgi:pimeloyl-ACP methyl ester carboxylesterase
MQSVCRRWWGRAAVVGLALIAPLPVCAAENSPSGGYAELPGVKLWFTDTGGTGTPIVLLHANTGTSASWEPQATAFAREGYRVIAFDRRGWGVATDLDALANHLKLDKFHLVGVAGGGFVSLDYAAWHPERLRSLVVAGSTGQFAEQEMRDITARVEIPELRKQAAVYREVGPSYRGVNPEGTKRWIEIEERAQQPGRRRNRRGRRTHSPSSPPSRCRSWSWQPMPISSRRRH